MSYNTVGIIKNGVKQKLPVVMVAPKVDNPDYVEVVADGVKTYGQLLNELRDAVSGSVGVRAVLKTGSYYAPMIYDDGGTFNFTYATNDSTGKGFIVRYKVAHSNSSITNLSYDGATWSLINSTSTVPASGAKFTIYYDSATLDLTTRASNCVYDNSNSGLSATEVQGAIDEIVLAVETPTSISYTPHADISVDAISCVKSAGMYFINGYITANANIGANTAIITLGETIPRYATSLLCDTSNLSIIPVAHAENTNTLVALWPLTSGHKYRFDITL